MVMPLSLYKLLFLAFIVLSLSLHAQDYPYADTESMQNYDLPVENPNAPTPSKADVRKSTRPTSLFRMALKIGGNFSQFQDRLCLSADSLGCLSYNNRSFNGFGIGGRISFGWDLAYQPVFLETEVGYQEKLMNLDSPLRNLLFSQGLFHRQRVGQKTLWKNGIIAQLDGRIAENSNEELSFALYPAIGFSTLIESGWFLAQMTFYIHQFRSNRNYFSFSTLVGTKF